MPNIVALKELYRVVENAPEELLHMRAIVETADCGTARCALGWCFVDEWFIRNTAFGQYADLQPGDPDAYGNPSQFDLAEEVFGLDANDANHLFAGGASGAIGPHAISRDEVLRNINRVMEGYPALVYDAILDADRADDDDESEDEL